MEKTYDPLTATDAELIAHGKAQIERRAHVRGPQDDGVTRLLNTVTFSRDEWKRKAETTRKDLDAAIVLIGDLISAINYPEWTKKYEAIKESRNAAKAWVEEIAERY